MTLDKRDPLRTEPPADLPWPIELGEETVEERFRWARRRGHPLYLWPEVSPDRWRSGLHEIERVTAAVLRSERPLLEDRSEIDIRALGVAGYTTGMGPLLGQWIETGRIDAGPAVRRLFAFHLAHGRIRAGRLREVLSRATRALSEVGVTPLVVKGSHSAVEYFPEPGTRPALDVDLVVPPAQFESAEEALDRAGFTLAVRERSSRKAVWSAPSASRLPRSVEVLHADSQYVVDLQGSLDRDFAGIGSIRPTRLGPDTGRSAPELGVDVRVLEQPELLLYHALHVSHGLRSLTLVRIVELVFMIRQDVASGALDWPAFTALLRDRGATRFVYPALTMAERLSPGTVDETVLAFVDAAASSRVRRVVDRLSIADGQPLEGLALEEQYMWCSSPAEHLRRVARTLLPPNAHTLRELGKIYRDRLYRLLGRKVFLVRSQEPPLNRTSSDAAGR
jgi:hypothetical protein